jgi:hypothetical protein
MKAKPNNPNIIRKTNTKIEAAREIRRMVRKSSKTRSKIADAGVIQPLIFMLSSSNIDARQSSLLALLNLAVRNERYKDLFFFLLVSHLGFAFAFMGIRIIAVVGGDHRRNQGGGYGGFLRSVAKWTNCTKMDKFDVDLKIFQNCSFKAICLEIILVFWLKLFGMGVVYKQPNCAAVFSLQLVGFVYWFSAVFNLICCRSFLLVFFLLPCAG